MSRWRASLTWLSWIVIGGAAVGFYVMTHGGSAHPKTSTEAGEEAAATRLPTHLHLSDGRREAARLSLETIEVRKLQPVRLVPGHLAYDDTRHLEIIAPADGVIRSLSARTSEQISVGQTVAIVDCPEIGERRADVLKSEAALELAIRERDQARGVSQSVAALLKQLDGGTDLERLHEQFQESVLGEFREPLFGAYSRLKLSDQLLTKMQPLADQGIASGRSFIEQQSLREVARAAYRSSRENAAFQSKQNLLKAESAVADAERRLSITRELLQSLTGSVQPAMALSEDLPLSHWAVLSPIAGTVEDVKLAAGERWPRGQGLMIVADTRNLWVQAELREHDWADLRLEPGREVQVECPSLPERRWTGTVKYVGRVQSVETRAIPLVVELKNDDGQLRPGMFARVAVPTGSPQEGPVLPRSAVMEHQGRQFVFVDRGDNEFESVGVSLGVATGDLVVVRSGLAAGDRVVTSGAFFLKSELLLEPEE